MRYLHMRYPPHWQSHRRAGDGSGSCKVRAPHKEQYQTSQGEGRNSKFELQHSDSFSRYTRTTFVDGIVNKSLY